MATLYTVEAAIQEMVASVTTGLTSHSPDTYGQPLTVRCGVFWPSGKALQDNVRKLNAGSNPTSLVTIYDRGLATDSTRWLPGAIVSQTLTPASMTTVLSGPYITSGGSVTITFAGTVNVGDALGVVMTDTVGNAAGVVPIGVAGDTPASMATKLVTLIQANATLNAWVSASAVGGVVTLTGISLNLIKIHANAGNGGTQVIEVGRRSRHFQIVVWARTPNDRSTVSNPIETAIAVAESNFGLTFPDGSMGRLTAYGDQQHDEAVLSDTYRRDFLICVEYGLTTTDVVYAVLAPILQITSL